jgi:hypothetical protein
MKRLNEISTSEINETIKATVDRLLGHHVGLSAILDHGRLGITCLVCAGRWAAVDVEGPRTCDGLDLMLIRDGDGYCEEGATDYLDSNGRVVQRI